MKRRATSVLGVWCLFLLVSTCAAYAASEDTASDSTGSFLEDPFSAPAGESNAGQGIRDPLEPYNRFMFAVNDKLYFYVLKPAARGYRYVVPEAARKRIKLFFANLETPVRFANCLLQAKFTDAGVELMRFVINTTGGCLGFFDPALFCWELGRTDEDTGQTLGAYGIGHGLYIVWPFFGPSSIRDTVGMAGDFFLDPFGYADIGIAARAGIMTFQAVNTTSLRIGEYEDFKAGALDPYTSLRHAYAQYRAVQVRQ